MIRITRWSPDTCGCVIEYEWDDQVSLDDRVHKVHAIVKKCGAHAGTPSDEAHYNLVLEENQRKNQAVAIVAGHPKVAALLPKRGSAPDLSLVRWAIAQDRTAVVYVEEFGLTPAEKAALQAQCDGQLGLGRVSVL